MIVSTLIDVGLIFMMSSLMFIVLLSLLSITPKSGMITLRVVMMIFHMAAAPIVTATGDSKPLRISDFPVLEANNYKIWAMSFVVMLAAGDKAVHALLKFYEQNGESLPDDADVNKRSLRLQFQLLRSIKLQRVQMAQMQLNLKKRMSKGLTLFRVAGFYICMAVFSQLLSKKLFTDDFLQTKLFLMHLDCGLFSRGSLGRYQLLTKQHQHWTY